MRRTITFTETCWDRTKILFLLIPGCTTLQPSIFSSVAQTPVRITGTVFSRQSGEPLPYVHVYTTSFRFGTVSDEDGHFFLRVNEEDTLVFSSIGYANYELLPERGSNSGLREVRIEMLPKIYSLDEVEISAYPAIEQFKQEILDMDVADRKKFSLSIPKAYSLPPEGPGDVSLNPSISLGSPFSALYNVFSREARQKRKLQDHLEKTRRHAQMDEKYNLEVVKRVTDLEEEAARRFMEWCKLEEDFILAASEYELAVAMLKCLDEFNKNDSIR